MDNELNINTIWIPPTASREDPLAQRGYLAIKFSGGVFMPAYDGDEQAVLNAMVGEIERRCRMALEKALANPVTQQEGEEG